MFDTAHGRNDDAPPRSSLERQMRISPSAKDFTTTRWTTRCRRRRRRRSSTQGQGALAYTFSAAGGASSTTQRAHGFCGPLTRDGEVATRVVEAFSRRSDARFSIAEPTTPYRHSARVLKSLLLRPAVNAHHHQLRLIPFEPLTLPARMLWAAMYFGNNTITQELFFAIFQFRYNYTAVYNTARRVDRRTLSFRFPSGFFFFHDYFLWYEIFVVFFLLYVFAKRISSNRLRALIYYSILGKLLTDSKRRAYLTVKLRIRTQESLTYVVCTTPRQRRFDERLSFCRFQLLFVRDIIIIII